MTRPLCTAIAIGPDRKVARIDVGERPPGDYSFPVMTDLTRWPVPDASHFPHQEVRAKRRRWSIWGRWFNVYSVFDDAETISILRREGVL